jgi:cytidylate kinase
MPERRLVIAIDGPSGSGKSTVARAVAERLNYLYVDSGAMYRAVALCSSEQGISPEDAERVASYAATLQIQLKKARQGVRVRVNDHDLTDALRRPQVSQAASKIATHGKVREVLVAQQQQIGAEGGIVMEGRDIGTVVFPRADLKVFLDASPEVRAQRRYREQQEQGIETSLDKTREEIRIRDERDSSRSISPLTQAADALYLDSTALTAAEVADVIVRLAGKRVEESKGRRV